MGTMFVGAFHLLFPLLAVSAALAVLAAIGGMFLVRYAARRTVQQPLQMVLGEEETLLAQVTAQPRVLPYLTTLKDQDFAAGAHGRIWAALMRNAHEAQGIPDEATDEDCAELGAALAEREDEFWEDVTATLQAGPAPEGDVRRLQELQRLGREKPLNDAAIVNSSEIVLVSGQERNMFRGSGLVLPTSLPDSTDPDHPPLQRVFVAPSRSRQIVSTLLLVVTAALLPGLALTSGLHGVALGAAVAAIAVLAAGSLVIALVDLDTFYIDFRVFLMVGAVAWVLTIIADVVGGHPVRLLYGLIGVVVIVGIFELLTAIFRMLGRPGQGFGDNLIVLLTAGIPLALTGSIPTIFFAVMSGFILALIGWTIGAVRGKVRRDTPFAFGPYLAGGWVVGWAGLTAGIFSTLGF